MGTFGNVQLQDVLVGVGQHILALIGLNAQ